MRVTRASYTDEFRAEAVALYRSTDRTMRQVAEDLGINHLTFIGWVERESMKRKMMVPENLR